MNNAYTAASLNHLRSELLPADWACLAKIDVEIPRYNLKTKGEITHVTIEEASASREWLTAALREFVVGQNVTVPAKAAAVLKLLT